jgi:hypothetical protein
VKWGSKKGQTSDKSGKADVWPTALRTFRCALTTVLAQYGSDQQPYGAEGPSVKAVDRELLRAEFFKIYSVDGETEQKRKEAKRKQFGRKLSAADEAGLIEVREVKGLDFVWLKEPAAAPHHTGSDDGSRPSGTAADKSRQCPACPDCPRDACRFHRFIFAMFAHRTEEP